MSQLALDIIAENKAKHARGEDASYLDLGNCGLTELPDLSGLDWVEILILSSEWEEFDAKKKQWVTLKSQNSGAPNRFEKIPPPHPNLPLLKKLVASDLGIRDGIFLEKLTGLTSLNLSSNQISDGCFLEKLTGLITLNLSSNKISDWCFLEKLTNLITLDLSSNKISDGRFLEKLTKLWWLDLSFNRISDGRFLEKLTKLWWLDLSSNKISDGRFLEKLTKLWWLDLSSNRISDLEPLLPNLKKGIPVILKEYAGVGINLHKNPLSTPPIGIVEQGNAAILNFFKQIEEQGGTAPLFEAKLIIVGEPDAGKTTLFQILKNPQHLVPNPQDKTTTGVKVEEGWRFSHIKLPQGIEFSANLWDFGGQEIQYMTHQFFLTARSLYVILTDDRRENANMAYWFSAADLFGRDDSGRQSPILVALNSKEFKSASKFDFDLHRFQNDYEHIRIEERRFDFASVGGYGRTDLIAKIKEMLVTLPHVGDPLPRRWPEVREALRKRGKQVNHISEAEFCRICTRNGVPKSEDQFYLSRYLHDLGSILHFQKDPELRDFIILNPSWAVSAVYSVLENKKVVEAEGMFDDTFLSEVWSEHFSRPEQSNLLRLMKRDRFEVCFELTGEPGKYLAPQLLPSSRPHFAWPKKGLLRFHFQYQFLPKGIVTRLHVRKHELVAKDENGKRFAWDKGAVFQLDDCQAMVEERELKDRRKIIEIAVKGPVKDRIFLLKLLRKEIEAIHNKWFSKVTFEQMVPCCCSDCVSQEEPNFYEFSELLKYERKNEKFIKCSKSEDLLEVPIYELLDGIFFKEELLEYREGSARKSGVEHHYHGTTYFLNDNSTFGQEVTKLIEEESKNDAQITELITNITNSKNNTLMKNLNWVLPILISVFLIGLFFSWANPGSKLDFFGWFKVEQGTNPPHEENIAPSQVTVIGSIKINNQNAKAEEVKKVYIKDQTLVKPTTLSGNVFKLESVKVPESRIVEIALDVKGAAVPPSAMFELPQPNANKTCDLGEVLIEISWPKPAKSGSRKVAAPVIVINNTNVIQSGDKQ